MALALRAYLAASRLAGMIAPLVLRRRLARGKEDPARLGERLGHAGVPRPNGDLIWLHGASVGEAMSMLPLIDALLAARPQARVLVTTGTVTSARRLAPLLPERAVHQFVPVDTAGAVARFLDHWRPDLGIWIESELWPRLVLETARRGVPMAMVNARISEKSAAGWARVPGMARQVLGAFRLILTQDAPTVERLSAFVDGAICAGNLKALVAAEPVADLAAWRAAIDGRPVWLAASTHAGEEEIVLAAHAMVCRAMPEALLILAPRHPERGEAVAALCKDAGMEADRRSLDTRVRHGRTLRGAVLLADTLGEMGLWYSLAPVTFVGGSLVAKGGHTPFEPIAAGSAVLHGSHVENFAPAYRALGGAEAVRDVSDAGTLAAAVVDLLGNETARAAMTAQATIVHKDIAPDVDRIAERVLALMESAQ
ncbi:MAG: 3-deoxy-D-manno-octulosonic acid transferase [Pseudomonadota bacterium]